MNDLELIEERSADIVTRTGYRSYTVLRDGLYIATIAPRVGDVVLTTHGVSYPRYHPTTEEKQVYGPFKQMPIAA